MTNLSNHTRRADLDLPARIWSLTSKPSKMSREKARRAILAFARTLPPDVTIAELKSELENVRTR